MHAATKQHIAGMITMIRQACFSIEAAIAAENQYTKSGKPGSPDAEEDEKYLSSDQEDLLGKMLGLVEDTPEAPKEPKGKKTK